MLNEDYKEMLQCLSANDVKFLIVGAYALSAYGYPRATGREKDRLDAEQLQSKPNE